MEKCKRCQYEWVSRVRVKGKKPKACPNCQSRHWDSELIKRPGPEKKYEESC